MAGYSRRVWLVGPAAVAVLGYCTREAENAECEQATPGVLNKQAEQAKKEVSQSAPGGYSPSFVRLEAPFFQDLAGSLLSRLPTSHLQKEGQQHQSRETEAKQKQVRGHDTAADAGSSAHFEKAEQMAEQYTAELADLRQLLQERNIQLPADRFADNDTELMRFAFTMGVCSARTRRDSKQALEATAQRIIETAEWLQCHRFTPESELSKWQPMLHWGVSKAVQHPLLVIQLGQATRECNGEQLDEFAEAIISQVQVAMESMFSDAPGKPEQMVVVADCAGASSLQGSHVLKLIKHVSLTLNRYYPGRLCCFYLVDLPRMIRWPVKAIVAMGHPSTHNKVILCNSTDPRLPPEFRNGH